MSKSIGVHVWFPESVFFAGEKFECKITFTCQRSDSTLPKADAAARRRQFSVEHVRSRSQTSTSGHQRVSSSSGTPYQPNRKKHVTSKSVSFPASNVREKKQALEISASSGSLKHIPSSSTHSRALSLQSFPQTVDPPGKPASILNNNDELTKPPLINKDISRHYGKSPNKPELSVEIPMSPTMDPNMVPLPYESLDSDLGNDFKEKPNDGDINANGENSKPKYPPFGNVNMYKHPNSTAESINSPASEFKNSHQRALSWSEDTINGRRSENHSNKSSGKIMMSYVQLSGSFLLDESLAQTADFDEIKQVSVVNGSMGGGVVGIQKAKEDQSLLSSLTGFGYNLLGQAPVSSIAEMKTSATSKSIPILTTPQSVLFVDMELLPGESKTFSYHMTLPKELPPSHHGKALKIDYCIQIGIQQSDKVSRPAVFSVPFRLFGFVDDDGDALVYDLFRPLILLKDVAKTALENSKTPMETPRIERHQQSSRADFQAYTEQLLLSSRRISDGLPDRLPSPGDANPFSPPPATYFDKTCREKIESTIRRPSMFHGAGALGDESTSNRTFGIAKNGTHVANVTLSRSKYKIGDNVYGIVEFGSESVIYLPCYHLFSTLESEESIHPDLAIRSATSISRSTRRVHGEHSESSIFTKRLAFSFAIPFSATPNFATNGVSNFWSLRLEFVVSTIPRSGPTELLTEIQQDDRGQMLSAKSSVECESFDCSIPLYVLASTQDFQSSYPGSASEFYLQGG